MRDKNLKPTTDFGPLACPKRRRERQVVHRDSYLANLPSASMYEQSFMHRNDLSHVVGHPTGATDYLATASIDGHVKFWKKSRSGIEFVKHYRGHIGPLAGLTMSPDGRYIVSVGLEDHKLKVFDVANFDMMSLFKLSFKPTAVCFVGYAMVAISSGREVHIVPLFPVDALDLGVEGVQETVAWKGDWSTQPDEVIGSPSEPREEPMKMAYVQSTLRRHTGAVHRLLYLPTTKVVVSLDKEGGLELWHPKEKFPFPTKPSCGVAYSCKSDTDFFELRKRGTVGFSMAASIKEDLLAVMCADTRLRLFNLRSGKLIRVYDEDIDSLVNSDSKFVRGMDQQDLGRRVAHDRDLMLSSDCWRVTAQFDETGAFLLVPSALGIKVYNVASNCLERVIGRIDAAHNRFLCFCLYQGRSKQATVGALMTADGKRVAERFDPIIVAVARNKRRLFVFTTREPADAALVPGSQYSRDVINEILDKDEQDAMLARGSSEMRRARNAVIHTTMGDIQLRLFKEEAPNAVENFTVHARENYYDGCLFHRVIKSFMIQTGDPLGDGTGGESIWGQNFKDEFHRALKHDRPYTVSMANAGPNTNGSQFFITCTPTPFLDGKHTVFGRVLSGFEVVHAIENVEVNGMDKPKTDVKILSIRVTA
ncbi:MAG: uncharacterized protein KVP18_004546 [Porospora cf. gigantea A]|uniref:uncharacterized protein n=1 Tax=Porospora cf. gigantea A TaxID=2853593 RepID=UPI00355A47CF|nr:MAG: hypothetical protein KVP18_004546 [Porospora cf. gigantea A]